MNATQITELIKVLIETYKLNPSDASTADLRKDVIEKLRKLIGLI